MVLGCRLGSTAVGAGAEVGAGNTGVEHKADCTRMLLACIPRLIRIQGVADAGTGAAGFVVGCMLTTDCTLNTLIRSSDLSSHMLERVDTLAA